MDTTLIEPTYKVSFGTIEDIPDLSNKVVEVHSPNKILALKLALKELDCSLPLSLVRQLARIERSGAETSVDKTFSRLERLMRDALKVANRDLPEGEKKVKVVAGLVDILKDVS